MERRSWTRTPGSFPIILLLVITSVVALGRGTAAQNQERIDVHGPMTLDRDGATYVLQEDVVVDGTPFTVAGNGITFDLNGHTITYGEGRSEFIPNPGFEEGEGGTPAHWDLSRAPGARRIPVERYWGDWELKVDMGAGSPQFLRSAPTTLPAGRTFLAYGWVRGQSGNDATLRVIDADSGEILAEDGTGAINRGFAMEATLKLDRSRRVLLEVELRGAGDMWCDEFDIRPTRQYGIASYSYRSERLFPDLSEDVISGGQNLVIRNGTIRQGSSRAVRSPAIKAKGPGVTLEDLVLEVNGINSPVVDLSWGKDIRIRDSVLRSTSPAVFNRMTPVALINAGRTRGEFTVVNCTLTGGAHQGIALYRNIDETGEDSRIEIRGNEIRNEERVTNGYAIAMTGCRNFRVLDNVIEPKWGRGIILDTAGGGSSHRNGEIAGNTIVVRERPNHEYGPGGLQVAGIRLRDYPPKGLFDIRIHDNTIRAETGPGLVGEANGITATLRSPGERVVIERNRVTSVVEGEGFSGYALLLEETTDAGTVIIRDNTFEGNVATVRFGDYDGDTTRGLVLERNILRRGEPLRGDFHTLVYGYNHGTEQGNALVDTVTEGGASLDDILVIGDGDKDLSIRWTLTVRAVDADGRPLPGAEVTIVDREGTTTSGITGEDGRFRRALPEWIRSGADLGRHRELSPYRVSVRYGGRLLERSVPLTAPREETFRFDVQAGEGPPPVEAVQRTDVH